MPELIIVQTTLGVRHDAQRIAAALVEQRLAACVQISGPTESVYHWQGQQETSEEWLVTIKTVSERFAAVQAAILALHPYEQPEIVAWPISASAGYGKWVQEAVRD